jgi:hypothetical protein
MNPAVTAYGKKWKNQKHGPLGLPPPKKSANISRRTGEAMSEHHKHFDIDENRLAIFERDGWQCRHVDEHGNRCPESATEIAHGIGQGIHAISITRTEWNGEFKESRPYNWIEKNVIHHPLDVFSSCRKHNDSFNIGFQPVAVREKLYEIHENLKQTGVIK